jgi:hypothetical protein
MKIECNIGIKKMEEFRYYNVTGVCTPVVKFHFSAQLSKWVLILVKKTNQIS